MFGAGHPNSESANTRRVFKSEIRAIAGQSKILHWMLLCTFEKHSASNCHEKHHSVNVWFKFKQMRTNVANE